MHHTQAKTMNILICEVEDILMTAIRFRLQKNGFNMVAVKNGQEAINELEKSQTDIAIIGTQTTEVAAIEIIRYVRKVMKSDLPIIIVADLDEGDNVLELTNEGANDFTFRPFKPKGLMVRIKRLLTQVESS